MDDLTPAELDELLAGWALDALDPEPRAWLATELAADPKLASRADELQQVVAELGQSIAAEPPVELRHVILQQASRSPKSAQHGSDAVTLFANQVRSLRELADTLAESDWEQRADPYEWTVHELLAHLLVIERYTAAQLGLSNDHPGEETHHLRMGADVIAAQRRRPPTETVAAWHEAATATIAARRRGEGPADDAMVELHGWPFDPASLLVARSFEVWTHADDIRRAVGRPLEAPVGPDLRTMSRFSVGTLPLLLPLVAPETSFTGARVVLTGDGGGTFDLGDLDRRNSILVVDVADYCRYAARRITPAALPATIEGDDEAANDLLAATRVFAV